MNTAREQIIGIPWESHCSRRASSLHCFNLADLLAWNPQIQKKKRRRKNYNLKMEFLIDKWINRKLRIGIQSHPFFLAQIPGVVGRRNRSGGDRVGKHGWGGRILIQTEKQRVRKNPNSRGEKDRENEFIEREIEWITETPLLRSVFFTLWYH